MTLKRSKVAIELDGKNIQITLSCRDNYEANVLYDDLVSRARKDGKLSISMTMRVDAESDPKRIGKFDILDGPER